jgi:alpha-1,6-mannosyltransferase
VLPGMRGAVESMSFPASAPFPWRLAVLGGASGLLYLLGSVWEPPLERTNHHWYVLWFSGVFVVYLLALLEIRRFGQQPPRVVVPLIVGWALIFRLSVLWVTPGFLSDDIYRYVWDGLVQQAGINPYNYPPEAAELGFLRDDTIFPMINRKWALTLYPPGAQLLFRLMAWLRPADLVALKAVILLADALSIALLLRLLKRFGFHSSRVLLYAWHPLVIVELGISGHLDGLMIPFVLLAFLWMTEHRPGRVGASLAMATLIKLYPAILFPVLYRKGDWRMPLVFFGLLSGGYLLYLDAGAHIIGYLPYYLAPDEFYNLSLRPILMWLAGQITDNPFRYVKWLSASLLVAVMVQCARQPHKSQQQAVQWGIGLIVLYLLLISPSVFQWYLVWLLALVPLTQSWLTPAWLYWSWSVNLGYLETQPVFAGALSWLHVVEYVPVFLWIIGYWWVVRSSKQVLVPRDPINAAS